MDSFLRKGVGLKHLVIDSHTVVVSNILFSLRQAFFSEDSSRLDQLLFLSENIGPSLDTNDKATLREIVTHLNTRMTRVLATANRRTDTLQHYIILYSEYKVALQEASDLIEMAEIRWGRVDVHPVTSLSHAHQQLTEVMVRNFPTSLFFVRICSINVFCMVYHISYHMQDCPLQILYKFYIGFRYPI
jgi:hypothetical protein